MDAARPLPEVTTRHGRRRQAAAWSLAIALPLIGASCSSSNTTAATTTSTTSVDDPLPTTTALPPPPDAVLTPVTDLQEGMCFNTVADPDARRRVVTAFDCERPHQFEVYALTDFEGTARNRSLPYPGDAAVRDWSERYCYENFELFVGLKWTESELEIDTWWPSAESWASGDHKVACTVTPRAGEQLTGSARNSKR